MISRVISVITCACTGMHKSREAARSNNFPWAHGQDFNTTQFYQSSAWVAEQLTEPLQPSDFGHRFARALHEAGAGPTDPKPSIRMSSNSSWVARSSVMICLPSVSCIVVVLRLPRL